MNTRMVAGKEIEFGEDGFMVNHDQWDENVAQELAHEIGIKLSSDHWQVINFVLDDYATQGDAPTIRRIKNVGGIPTKQLYDLFPKGPAKKVAYVAGLKKPSGCI